MLQLQAVAKRFRDNPIYSGVNLHVSPGEFVAIVGDSGVGKSTLLNAISGLDPVSEGTVIFRDVDITRLSDAAAARLRREHVGFVFQAFHVLPHLSVAQNVALPLWLNGRDDPARVESLLQAMGLQGLGPRLPQTLSGGQLQRVAIARALVHRPALLLADEPTGNLDPENAQRVLQVLARQVREEGAACVLVTHSDAAARVADRVLRLTPSGLVSHTVEA